MSNRAKSKKEQLVDATIAKTPGFRWKTGMALLILGLGGTFVANRLAADNTYRMIRIFIGVGTTLALLMIWWLFFSGISIGKRIFGVVILLTAGACLKMCLKDVTFEGDMKPHLHFVWDAPSASEQAAKWIAENAPDPTEAPKTSASVDTETTPDQRIVITEKDWPRYCGATGDRLIREPQCSFDWKANPPRELWRHPVGDAWSSFAIVGAKVFTQEQRGELECVVCYDAASGKEIWRREDTARYDTAQGGTGPRGTPTVTEDAVFALGATGILNALNPMDGSPLWQRNICTDAGATIVEWGMSGAPLIFEQTVIVDAGGDNNKALIAYDRKSGEIVWASDSHKAGYTSPRLEKIGQSLQLLVFHGDGLAGFEPATGKKLWEYPWTNQYKINVAQPMMFGDHVFLSSGYDSGCVLIAPLKLTDGVPADVWPRNKNMKLKFNEAVQLGDFVYGLDDGILACIDIRTGDRTWKGGRYRYGQVLLWGDKLIVQSETGFVAVVEANSEKFIEVARLNALNDRTWNVPVVNQGRLYVRNASEAACYQLP